MQMCNLLPSLYRSGRYGLEFLRGQQINLIVSFFIQIVLIIDERIKLVSLELLHFGVIARLFRQIGGHSSRFLLCSLI